MISVKETYWDEEYTFSEEDRWAEELLEKALEIDWVDCVNTFSPVSFWTDYLGYLYIRWNQLDSQEKAVVRYWFDENHKMCMEPIPVRLSKKELLRSECEQPTDPVVIITGDTHRNFSEVEKFCKVYKTTREDVMIILGDAGINLYSKEADEQIKQRIDKLDITLFCIHGNHERRPGTIDTYRTQEWHGGKVYYEPAFPNILFAIDGEIYDIAGKKTLVIGGAYSVDKWYRLRNNYAWFEDEQPSEEIKQRVEAQLECHQWKVDVVLSHTVPYQYRPTDKFLPNLDQSTVDSSTEKWLYDLEIKLDYQKWYAGHFHCDRKIDKVELMFHTFELFCSELDLGFK